MQFRALKGRKLNAGGPCAQCRGGRVLNAGGAVRSMQGGGGVRSMQGP